MLIWCDVETSGLDPERDILLEVAMIVTDDELIERARYQVVTLEALGRSIADYHPAVQEMHTKNGLWVLSQEQGVPLTVAAEAVLAFVRDWTEPKGAQLAGSTVSFDRAFLRRRMPAVEAHFHYRNLDITAFNEVARRFWPKLHEGRPQPSERGKPHRAMDDVEASLATLRYYVEHLAVIAARETRG
jgi:oligoribonuclease